MLKKTVFPKEFRGYNPVQVEEKINEISKSFKEDVDKIEEEFAANQIIIDEYQEKIKLIKEELDNYKTLEHDIAKTLYDAHIEAVRKLLDMEEKARGMEKISEEKVLVYEQENDKLKSTMRKLLNEMQSIAKEYNLALEAFENG